MMIYCNHQGETDLKDSWFLSHNPDHMMMYARHYWGIITRAHFMHSTKPSINLWEI